MKINRDKYKEKLTQENIFNNSKGKFLVESPSHLQFFFNKVKRIVTRKFHLVKVFDRAGESFDSLVKEGVKRRRKIIWSSLFVVILFAVVRYFVVRYTHSDMLDFDVTILLALVFSVVMGVLMFWIFGGYLLSVSSRHVVIFTCSSVVSLILFFELFYLKFFGNFYEILSFVMILGFMFAYVYVVFLTANIFLVSRIKDVPLLQVAQSTGYMVAIVSIYFLTFVYFSFNLHVLFSIILFLLYTVLVYPVIATFGFSKREIAFFSVGVGWGSYLSIIPLYLYPVTYRVGALFPTVVSLSMLGILMNSWRKRLNLRVFIEYIVVISVVLYFVFTGVSYF